MEAWSAATAQPGLALPQPNPFIPTDFTLVCDEEARCEGTPTPTEAAGDGRGGASGARDSGGATTLLTMEAVEAARRDGRRAPDGVHLSSRCDGCGMYPLLGDRYHSTVRDDWDLCARCHAAGSEDERAGYECVPPTTFTYIFQAQEEEEEEEDDDDDDDDGGGGGGGDGRDRRGGGAGEAESSSLVARLLSPSDPTRVVPRLALDDELLAVWHKTDLTFRRPITNFVTQITTPLAYTSPTAACMTQLLCRLISYDLSEFCYPAECAAPAPRCPDELECPECPPV